MNKISLIFVCVFLTCTSYAQFDNYKIPSPLYFGGASSDTENIKSVIYEFEFTARDGFGNRFSRLLSNKIDTNNIETGDTSSLSANFLEINIGNITFNSNNATVQCTVSDRMNVNNLKATINLIRIAGRWKIDGSSPFIKHIIKQTFNGNMKEGTHHQTINTNLLKEDLKKSGNTSKSIDPKSNKIKDISITNFIMSNSALIPFPCYYDDSQNGYYQVDRSTTQSGLGVKLFGDLTDGKIVYLNNQQNEFGVTSDKNWGRIIFGKLDYSNQSNSYFKSYGDNNGDQKVKWPSSIGLDQYGNIFVLANYPPNIVQLKYDDGLQTVSFVRNISLPGVIDPVDIYLDWNPSTPSTDPSASNDYLWVVDRLGNAIFKFSLGTTPAKVGEYTSISGIQLVHPTKILANYDGGDYAVIDEDQKRLILFYNPTQNQSNPNALDVTEYAAYDFSSIPNTTLTSIGTVLGTFTLWVADASNGMYHIFGDAFQQYLGSIQTLADNQPQWASPKVIINNTMSNSYGMNYSLKTIDQWDDTHGVKQYFPGVDLINPIITVNNKGINIAGTIIGYCKIIRNIYNSQGNPVYQIDPPSVPYISIPGIFSSIAQISYSNISNIGKYDARFSLTPYFQNYYNGYTQTVVKDVWFAFPLAGSLNGPSSGILNQTLNYTINMTSGSGDFSYNWYRQESGSNSWTLISSGSSTIQTQVLISDFTLRCDIKDNFNGSVISYLQVIKALPSAPINPTPSIGAINIPITQVLSWSAVSGATSYTVHGIWGDKVVNGTSYSPSLSYSYNYGWSVTANNAGGSTTSAPWSFTTVPAPPTAPINPTPSIGAINIPITQVLSWSAVSGATSYTVHGIWGDKVVTGTSYSPSLSYSYNYGWSVTANNAGGSATSASWSFTTVPAPPTAPTNPTPANGTTNVPITQVLSWSAVSGATSYTVHGIWGDKVVTGTSYSPSLSYSYNYGWSVTATNVSGSATSASWSFSTVPAPPPAPTLSSPANGATNVSRAPTLSWSACARATSYTINGSWGSATVSGTSYKTPTLAASTKFNWSVTATNVGGSATSGTWSFTTGKLSKRSICIDGTESDYVPEIYSLYQNYPNPFNPSTTIQFDLHNTTRVVLKIYDILGRDIRTLLDEEVEAGSYTLQWNGQDANGRNVHSGIYFYRLSTEMFTGTKKMMLLR